MKLLAKMANKWKGPADNLLFDNWLLLVIEGGIEAINRFRPILIVERNEPSFANVDRMLRSCGYCGRKMPNLHRSLFFNEPDYDVLYIPERR
jgi:hypothetical protein